MRRAVIALLPLLCVLPSFQRAQAKELAALALYFVANNLHDLVRMDGTSASTAVVAEDSSPLASWSNTRGVVPGGGLVYCLEGNGQVELWRVEGLQGRKVAGLAGSGCLPRGPAVGGRACFSLDPGTPLDSPDPFTGLGNTAYFTAINAARGREVWKTTGTPERTQRVWTAEDGSPRATIRWMPPLHDTVRVRAMGSEPRDLTPSSGLLIFTVDAFGAREMWRSDGTPEGTFRIHEKLRFSPSAPILSSVPNGPLLFAEEAPGGHGGAAPARTEGAGQYLLRVRDRFSAHRYG